MNLFKLVKSDKTATLSDAIIAQPADIGSFTPSDTSYTSRTPGTPLTSTKTVKANKLPNSSGSSSIIDVYKTFDWTTTPKGNSGFDVKTPFAHLEEYRLEDLYLLKSLLYFLTASASQIGGVAGSIVEPPVNFLTDQAKKFLSNETTATISSVKDRLTTATSNMIDGDVSPWLKDLNSLYQVSGTGFSYYFPYLDNIFTQVQNSYQSITQPLVRQLMEGAQAVTEFTRLAQPGQYVESPQIFATGYTGSSINIEFPLLNTISFESAAKNYQLLWLLIFQNTPYRVTKTLLELPKVYRVRIPGIRYMHFAYINSLEVQFIGTRRTVNIPMPPTTIDGIQLPSTAQVVMPDAYIVRIGLTSLLSDSSNMMIENWKIKS